MPKAQVEKTKSRPYRVSSFFISFFFFFAIYDFVLPRRLERVAILLLICWLNGSFAILATNPCFLGFFLNETVMLLRSLFSAINYLYKNKSINKQRH
jgi:hypothetical protein